MLLSQIAALSDASYTVSQLTDALTHGEHDLEQLIILEYQPPEMKSSCLITSQEVTGGSLNSEWVVM